MLNDKKASSIVWNRFHLLSLQVTEKNKIHLIVGFFIAIEQHSIEW